MIRDIRGERPVSVHQAFTNATWVIRLERWLGPNLNYDPAAPGAAESAA